MYDQFTLDYQDRGSYDAAAMPSLVNWAPSPSLIWTLRSLLRLQLALISPQNSLLFSRRKFDVTHGIIDINWPSKPILKPEKRENTLLLRPVRVRLPAQPPTNPLRSLRFLEFWAWELHRDFRELAACVLSVRASSRVS